MIQDIDLLNHIHQSADMGRNSVSHLIGLSDDAEFTSVLNRQLREYEKIYERSDEMLKERSREPKDATAASRAMSYLTSNLKTITDRSPSKLSEMIIEGSTMGITNLTKQLNDYAGNDPEVRKLAEKELKTEQSNIEEMKQFL